jgi:hypothetical protein
MHNDPWWKHAWDSVSDWVDKHVDLLKEISSVLKMVSAVAGLLSFIPFLSPICGPLAMIAGGLALGIDFVLCATGHGDWKAFAIDAALMALPVAGHFASEAIMARQAGRAVGEYADEVRALDLSSRQRPGDVAALRTRNAGENLFRGASKPQVELNPRIQSALDRVPEDVRSPFHGKCAEIKALNNAANADARLKGSVIATSKVRKLGNLDHGAPHEPCGSCQHVLDQLGVKYVVGR